MYKPHHNDMMGSPQTTAGTEMSSEIDGTPIMGVYRGWSPGAGEGGALRVVNGSERQSVVSELESPTSPKGAKRGGRGVQETIQEQPVELEGER